MSDDELIERAKDGEVLGGGKKQIEALIKKLDKLAEIEQRLVVVEQWIDRRESYESEQNEYK